MTINNLLEPVSISNWFHLTCFKCAYNDIPIKVIINFIQKFLISIIIIIIIIIMIISH